PRTGRRRGPGNRRRPGPGGRRRPHPAIRRRHPSLAPIVSRRTALFTALGGVGLAVLLVVLLLVSAGSGHVQGTNPSSPVFVIGNAGSYQHQVEKEHRPLIFPDPNEKGKNIVVPYVTGSGSHAFEAHVPNDTRCIIQWHRDTLQFTDC